MHKIAVNDVSLSENLARELKKRRRRAGLRQIDLAIRSRITLRTLQRYESGNHAPDNIALHRLASALGTSSAEILDAANTPDPPVQLTGGRQAAEETVENASNSDYWANWTKSAD